MLFNQFITHLNKSSKINFMISEQFAINPLRSTILLIFEVALITISINIVSSFIVIDRFQNESVVEIVDDFRVLIIVGVCVTFLSYMWNIMSIKQFNKWCLKMVWWVKVKRKKLNLKFKLLIDQWHNCHDIY